MSDRYNTPEPGTSDWHVPLNENFDAIGADIDDLETKAQLWGDYEIVFDDETPESDTYIRLETE